MNPMNIPDAICKQAHEAEERALRELAFSMREPPNPNFASEFQKRLEGRIRDFDSRLNGELEVGVRLVSFGQSVVFHPERLGHSNPSLIIFIGRMPDGTPVELIQHITQINMLLTTLPRRNPEEPKRPFGFSLDHGTHRECSSAQS